MVHYNLRQGGKRNSVSHWISEGDICQILHPEWRSFSEVDIATACAYFQVAIWYSDCFRQIKMINRAFRWIIRSNINVCCQKVLITQNFSIKCRSKCCQKRGWKRVKFVSNWQGSKHEIFHQINPLEWKKSSQVILRIIPKLFLVEFFPRKNARFHERIFLGGKYGLKH